MNKIQLFLFSKDGLVTLTTFILFAVVNYYNTYNTWINFIARVGTLSIFIYILWRTSGKKILQFLSQRQENIITGFDKLKQQKQAIETQLLDIEKLMENIDVEKDTIFTEYQSQANKLQTSIIHETEERINYIHKQTQHAVDALSKNILQQLYKKLANEIISATEIELKKTIDTTKHYELIDNALKKVTAFD